MLREDILELFGHILPLLVLIEMLPATILEGKKRSDVGHLHLHSGSFS